MTTDDIYQKLAEHLSRLGMGYPVRDDLLDILKENFTPQEAEVAFAIPNTVIPLEPVSVEEISAGVDMPREEIEGILESLAEKGMLFSATMDDGEQGYALQQVGFGFPQTFFWTNEDTPHGRKMAMLTAKYFNRKVTREAFSPSETKPYRYIPVGRSVEPAMQAVLPHHTMDKVIEEAEVLAVAHCSCRVAYALAGRGCEHPTEVCMKFNDMAQYAIDRGFAREITKEEALDIIKLTEEAGLVHFVDNADGDIQHNCNCCGCACWNVGSIRRRKIPRDVLMAVYFVRETDEDECTGCGACVEACPVEALKMEGDFPVVDREWCIGCGVCSTVCPSDAVKMVLRPDRTGELPAADFKQLHETIRREKGLS
jgi:NAD-dependent dihydropyrimidine dehydrogenase PreA subunit